LLALQKPAGRLRKIIFLVYLFGVTVVLLEVACRFGVVKTDFYRVSNEIRKTKASERILVIGDSFSLDLEGMPMGILGDTLESRGIGVLNVSGSGSGPVRHLRKLEEFGERFQPDVVLLNLYVGNDFTDTRRDLRVRRSTWRRQLRGVLVRHSYLMNVYVETKSRIVLQREQSEIRKTIEEELGMDVLNPFLYDLAKVNPGYVTDNLAPTDSLWEINRSVLSDIAEHSEELGARLIVCVFPHTAQINRDHHEFLRKVGFDVSQDFLDTQRSQDLLSGFCREEGIDYFDLLPQFREHRSQSYYLVDDVHWNESGNRFAFRLVKGYLEELEPF
jgi:hypothetical protein